jgi:single-strand DNA-binding protein
MLLTKAKENIMSQGINRCTFIGNLGAKPELVYTDRGIPVCRFSIAVTTRIGKNEDGTVRKRTDWVQLVAWRGLAEVVTRYLDKGSKIYVDAAYHSDEVKTDDGSIEYYHSFHIRDMNMLLSRGDSIDASADPVNQAKVFMTVAESQVKLHPDASWIEILDNMIAASKGIKNNFDHGAIREIATKILDQNPTLPVLELLSNAVEFVSKSNIALTAEELETDAPLEAGEVPQDDQ